MASSRETVKKSDPKRLRLLCVAHPDDETIFFGGLLMRKAAADQNFRVVCMTNGNADGQGDIRKKQFLKACRQLGVAQPEWWGFEDIYEKRLPVDQIISRLRELPTPAEIYTHGILGEYGHPHHQDVSYAVHKAFSGHKKIFACAYNAFPETRIQLSAEEFDKKAEILTHVYGSETQRFLNLLPATSTEGYLRLSEVEVEAMYDYLARNAKLNIRKLRAYKWLAPFLEKHRAFPRPF